MTAASVTADESIDYPQPLLPAGGGSRLIHQGDLTRLFDVECERLRNAEEVRREVAGMSHKRAASYLVSRALTAVNQLSDEMAFDAVTRRQVDSAVEALKVTVRTLLTELPGQASGQELELRRAPADVEGERAEDHHRRRRGLAEKLSRKRGLARTASDPDEPPAPVPPDETWALAERGLRATRQGLERVEKLFDQARQPSQAPAAAWYDNGELTAMIQQLLRARRERKPEHAMLAIEQLEAALPSWGVDVVVYDVTRRPEEQATSFGVTSLTDDEACRYETAMPAMLAAAPGGGRRVLARGEVRRLPEAGATPDAPAVPAPDVPDSGTAGTTTTPEALA